MPSKRLCTILFAIAVLVFGIAVAKPAHAAIGDSVSGFAWSETVGWIIFNSDPRVRDLLDPVTTDIYRKNLLLLDFGIPIVAGSDDAYSCMPGTCQPGSGLYSHTESWIYAGERTAGNIGYGGWRFTNLAIPAGAIINRAYANLHNSGIAPGNPLVITNLAFEKTLAPPTFSDNPGKRPFDRWNGFGGSLGHTTFMVSNWNWSNGSPAADKIAWVKTPELKAGVQELVSPTTALQDIVLLEDGSPELPNFNRDHQWRTIEKGPSWAAKLYVEYSSGGAEYDFDFPSATNEDFGVHVDPNTGNFKSSNVSATGAFAWSSNIGWIKFNPTGPYPTTTVPVPGTYDGAAYIDMDTDPDTWRCGGLFKICGWARACAAVADKNTCEGATDPNAGGWDGWMYLGAVGTSPGVSYNNTTKKINGWAWGGNAIAGEGIGWISFNNVLPGGITFDTVFLDLEVPPAAANPTETYGSYCTALNNVVPVRFEWDFTDANVGDVQEAFQVIMRTDGGFDPAENTNFNSCTSSANDPNPTGGTCESGNGIQSFNPYPSVSILYNYPFNDDPANSCDPARYAWRVRVKDSSDDKLWSAWSPFFALPHSCPVMVPPDEAPRQFGTINHQAPDISFTLNPGTPTLGELVTFTDTSTCYYSSGGTNLQYDCKNNNPVSGAANRYQWDFDGDGDWDCDSDVNPSCRIGPSTFTYTVLQVETTPKLRITNPIMSSSPQISHTCETTRSLDIGLPFPEWEEVSPF